MKILFIGGKRFAGYHMVRSALERGHEVVLFNRGQTSPELFPECETIIGDRTSDLSKLSGRSFDAVFDPGCYFPSHMRQTADFFADKTERFFVISTVAVYPLDVKNLHENSPMVDEIAEDVKLDGDSYGGMKVAIENIAHERFGERLTVVRPGYICGYRDNTDRFTYWPVKMHYQKKMLSPTGDFDFMFVDARDLADFSVSLVERNIGGSFNVTGPEKPVQFSDFLRDCRDAVNPACEILELSDEKLAKLGLKPDDLPKHFPLYSRGLAGYEGIFNVDVSKAVANGLTFRPTAQTALDALKWHLETGVGEDGLIVGLKSSAERELVDKLEALR